MDTLFVIVSIPSGGPVLQCSLKIVYSRQLADFSESQAGRKIKYLKAYTEEDVRRMAIPALGGLL